MRGYRNVDSKHLVPASDERAIEDIAREDVERWRSTLAGLSARTRNLLVTVLHGIFRRAMKVYGLRENPAAVVEKLRVRHHHDIDAFSPDEVRALARATAVPDSSPTRRTWVAPPEQGHARGAMVAEVGAQVDLARRFLTLHHDERPLLLPNAWDAGSAKLLESLGFAALATTSSGFAATLGRLDYAVTRDEALAHCSQIVEAAAVPVSADLENGFADDPDEVAQTVRRALGTGLAGCSIEDATGHDAKPIYDRDHATARVAAAAEVAHGGPVPLVLTARCENVLHGRADLGDTIERLQAYQQAGADVLYAPGLTRLEDIRQVVAAVELPVNVLAMRGVPPVDELAACGVKRVSVGGHFAFAALGAAVEAARELREDGTYGFVDRSAVGARAARAAFGG
jgi:2-methylisocitrate lyase-like PEP mutase family enzyme